MNVLNDLFATTKSEFPEQQQMIDTWLNSMENFRKQVRYLSSFLIELTNVFDQYGKQLQKSGRNLGVSLSKISTTNSKNLSECIRNCGAHSEMLGGVYSKTALALSSTITQKHIKINETINEIKKRIAEDTSAVMKDLSQAKISHLKVKVKYEKAKKDYEIAIANTNKIKNDPVNSYQPAVVQRSKEKTKSCKKEVSILLKSLNEHVEIIYQKTDFFETTLFNLHSNTLTFEQDALQSMLESLQSVMQMFINIALFRKEQSLYKQDQIEGLANITLDMVGGRDSENNTNTLEYLSCKLDTRVNSCEDRLKVMRNFRGYLVELLQCEDNLIKSLEKAMKAIIMPEYFEVKVVIKSGWERFLKNCNEISKLHIDHSKDMGKKVLEPVTGLVMSQGNLSKNLQMIVQKIIKDHALVQEECLREFEKLKRAGEDAIQKRTVEIKEKMQNSNQNTGHLVLSSLADNSNQEASYLQILKLAVISIYNMEDSFNNSLLIVADDSFKFLQDVRVGDDFKNIQVYVRKNVPIIASFGEASQTSESAEGEEDDETLTKDNLLQKFALKSNTSLIDSFSCALSQKLLLQGRMYITTTHICFHSYFNSTTIFGRETLISIPLCEVMSVEKRSTLIFDNVLCLVTKTSNFLFKSFIYREQAYAILENLLKMNKPVEEKKELACDFSVELRKFRLEIHKTLQNSKTDTISSQMTPDVILKNKLIDVDFIVEFSPQQVFEAFFSDESLTFYCNYLTLQGNTNIEVPKWNPAPPDYYISNQSDTWNFICKRIVVYTHAVKERIPMMPKTCLCTDSQTVYFLSKQEFVIESQVRVSGVPLSDCFASHFRWRVSGEQESCIEARFGVEFFKATMFKGKIETSGLNEAKTSVNSLWVPLAKRKVQEIKGNPVTEVVEIPQKIDEEKSDYEKWIVYGVFVMIVFYMWLQIRSLQRQIDELKVLIIKA